MNTIKCTSTLKVLTCWTCSVQFAVPLRMYQGFEEKPETFYCPKGCRLVLGEAERKAELRNARQGAAWGQERESESRKAIWIDYAKRRLVDILGSGPKTRTDLNSQFKRFDEPLQVLLEAGEVVVAEVIKNRRSYAGYALPVQAPESQERNKDASEFI